jgi:hypothetical protein
LFFLTGCVLPENDLPIEEWRITEAYVDSSTATLAAVVQVRFDDRDLSSFGYWVDYEMTERFDFGDVLSITDRTLVNSGPGDSLVTLVPDTPLDPDTDTDAQVVADTSVWFYRSKLNIGGSPVVIGKCRIVTDRFDIEYR